MRKQNKRHAADIRDLFLQQMGVLLKTLVARWPVPGRRMGELNGF